ncbi:hypothetical protein T492DRAFT_1081144 [Pavlovales sp. CCMP2436]|nr:hypothetical protein T492DRAFT_1081144 [Pavlovales sp. CCMP2436]
MNGASKLKSAPKQPAKVQQPATALTAISGLRVNIQIPGEPPADGKKQQPQMIEREVEVGVLQAKAGQRLVLVVGSVVAVEDILLSALVEARQIARTNVLVIPVVYVREGAEAEPLTMPSEPGPKGPKGFGKPKLRAVQQPFVAPALDSELWSRALGAEVAAARAQGAKSVPPFDPLDKGLLFVVGPDQTVLQRRLGRPSPTWEQFLAEVEIELAASTSAEPEPAAA